MSSTLVDTLAARAGRAATDLDPDEMILAVREHSEHRARQRVSGLAAGGSALAIAALVAGVLLLTPDDRHPAAAGGQPTASAASAPIGTDLVEIAPAPADAPLSISLVPRGFGYLGNLTGDSTLYGPPGLADAGDNDYFVGKLVVAVGVDGPTGPFPLTVNGRPARYDGDADGSELVIKYRDLFISIDVPRSAPLTEDEMLQMGSTLDIRDTSNPAHG